MTRLPKAALAEIECSDAASSQQRRNTQTIDQRIASAAGLGQIEAAGVGDGQRHQSADAVVVLGHGNILAVDLGSGSFQRLAANLADLPAVAGHDVHGDVLLQQRVAAVCCHLGDDVRIVLQTLDQHYPVIDLAGHGAELGGVGLLVGVSGHIVNALGLVQLRIFQGAPTGLAGAP